MELLTEAPYALMIVAGIVLALYLANLFYDYAIPQYISRKIGHLGGCVGFLLCPFVFSSFIWPMALTTGFTMLLLYARLRTPSLFRGVGGSGRIDALAEIHFPATGIVLIGAMWGWLNAPWYAVIPLAFMGGGDAVTGIIRSRIYGREVKGLWGSAGMLASCLLLAYFIQPYWIGAAGAVMAVLAERYTLTRRYIDDNLSIPIASAVVMVALYMLVARGV